MVNVELSQFSILRLHSIVKGYQEAPQKILRDHGGDVKSILLKIDKNVPSCYPI